MARSRSRFTLRQMMIGVAVLAVILYLYSERIRWARSEMSKTYSERAEFHRKLMEHQQKQLEEFQSQIARGHVYHPKNPALGNDRMVAGLKRDLRYRDKMRRRNLYAMAHPFEYTPPPENPNRDLAWPMNKLAPWEIEPEPWDSDSAEPLD